jgi:hypothetical protein
MQANIGGYLIAIPGSANCMSSPPQMLLEANKDARVDLYLEKAGIVSIWLPYEQKHIYFATSLDACNRAKLAASKPSK